jgi:hypothetical protein
VDSDRSTIRATPLSRAVCLADPLLGLVHGHDHRKPRAQHLVGGSRMATYLGQQGKKLFPPFPLIPDQYVCQYHISAFVYVVVRDPYRFPYVERPVFELPIPNFVGVLFDL